ncbi:10775_t:CDS:2 [Gigaspora margarita]|uniref:10775_t:CDS:1 n=1 Tax=Gigaspora margarita TaxID=4874 RepID=A0ABN7VRV7_GIGMA|nr:10775_t:CDS:2 [Gigaspora margarita]
MNVHPIRYKIDMPLNLSVTFINQSAHVSEEQHKSGRLKSHCSPELAEQQKLKEGTAVEHLKEQHSSLELHR